MKNVYLLLSLLAFCIKGISQTTNCITIRGDRTSGKFSQLWLDSNAPYHCDTAQPEMGTAAWTCNAVGYPTCNMRSAFRYDVSSIPANAVVTSARLYVYAKTNNINGYTGSPTYGSNNTSLLQKITAKWTVAGTGWANQPPATTANQKTLAQSSSTAQNYVIDVTDFVQGWVNKPDSNFGMLMRLQTESYYNSMIFNSGSATDSTLRPKLEICYTIPPPTTCTNSLIIKGNPTDGKFKAALMGTINKVASDTAQPEIVAAAWTCNASGFPTCDFRTMLRYDVSSIPAHAVITDAKLYLYAKTNNINGNYGNPTFGTANTALLQKAISPWNNATIGWNTQPTVSTATQKILPQSTSTKQNYVVDVTDFVQSWVNKPDSNYGVMLRLQTETYYNSMVFNSGQAVDSLRPRLEICYSIPTTPPPPADTCGADFKDSTTTNYPATHILTAIPKHNLNKKPVRVCWTFGDGKDTCITYDSTINNFYTTYHTYNTPGAYTVCAKITYAGGCVANMCKTITVVAPPPPPPVCNNSLVISGNPFSGKYQQALMGTWGPNGSDTAQTEIVAAAWTCNAIGQPTCDFRSMLRYDVSSIPANAVITNAKLYLYAKTNNINGNYGNPTFGTANTALLQKAVSPWNLSTVGWNLQPAVTTVSQKILPQSTSTKQNYVVDVTDFVQSWVNKPDSNYGVMLRLQNETYYNSMVFNSGQAVDSLRPRLEICYTLTSADSCKADFKDTASSSNSASHLLTAIPWHNNNKKPVQVCWTFGDGTDTCINYSSSSTYNVYSVSHTYKTAGTFTACVKITYEGGCIAQKCKSITVIAPQPPVVCNNSLVIKGNPTDGKFKAALMGTINKVASDTAQPEIVAAAWTCNASGFPTCDFRTMLRYDVSSIPANAVITDAKLYLYAKTNNINGNYGNPTYGSNNTALLQKATSSWNNATIGWNTQPSVSTATQKILAKSTNTRQNYVVEITDFVQSWVNKPDSNYGMLLRLQTESYYNSMVFNSGQAADSLKPRLEICYTVPTPGTDSCRANFIDSISDNNPLRKLFIASPWNAANKKPVQICWNFGDGKDTCINYTNASANYSITHTYPKHGNYNVCVTIKYDGGCVASRCRTITVFGTPSTTPTCADSKTLIVRGDRTSGKFKQLWLDSNAPFQSDTTQPEMGAAAWTCNAGGYPTCNFRSLFRYELGSLPTNTRITSAKLYLYAKTNNINGYSGAPTYGSNNAGLLQQVTAPWKTGGTGWNNQPTTTTERQKQLARSSSTAQNYVIDVTDFVQTWVKHPEQNNGMLLRLQSEQYYNSLIFNSGSAPDSLKPRLEICYQADNADSNKVEVKLYPNPTTGPLLAWVFTSEAQKGSASLYDLRGNLKQVLRPSINFYAGVNVVTFYINRISVPAGQYYVKIWVGSEVRTFKIMVL
ncbi:DNRLRE domain-containing protein [Niastella caeni]|nr:DNRLRE domain-containing protein [Niastella caeni]